MGTTTVSRRIDTAIKHLRENDYENALIQISIAIDRTAKKKYPNVKKVGSRIKKIIQNYESFIYFFASNGQMLVMPNAKVVIGTEDLPNMIYKSVRCALQHGDDLTDNVVIEDGVVSLGMRDGKFILNRGHIFGLLFSVVGDNVNQLEFCESNPFVVIKNKTIMINDLWGNLKKIEDIIGYKNNFPSV